MKGIIVEIKGHNAYMLCEDGIVRETRNRKYEMGQEVNAPATTHLKKRIMQIGMSCAAAVVLLVTGAVAYATPVTYVSMDVNPSIEFQLNFLDRVLKAEALNEDAEAILKGLDLKNLKIDQAMEETTDKLIEDGYLTEDGEGDILIAACTDDGESSAELAKELEETLTVYVEEKGLKAEIMGEAVGEQRVREARTLGVTAGKLNLVEKMMERTDQSTTDAAILAEWLEKPVKEINQETKENRIEKQNKAVDQGAVTEQAQEEQEDTTAEPQTKQEKMIETSEQSKEEVNDETVAPQSQDQKKTEQPDEPKEKDPKGEPREENTKNSQSENRDQPSKEDK